MRGTRGAVGHADLHVGIIPAYAGNTQPRSSPRRVRWDHPRICGEHLMWLSLIVIFTGSSPRMRGTLILELHVRSDHGIIPAYAGNTKPFALASIFCRDHPRVCGEHQAICFSVNFLSGSSPRMRGTLTRDTITPACKGSSPRMRGTQ